jgi:integrase
MPTYADNARMKASSPRWTPEKGERYEIAAVGNSTVKIYRRQRQRARRGQRVIYEIADYSDPQGYRRDGKRRQTRRRLLGFHNLAKARAAAKRLAGQVATGNAAAAQMLPGDAASYGRAVELLRTTGVSLEVAASTFAKCFELLKGDALMDASRFYARHRIDQVTPRLVRDVVNELVENRTGQGSSARYLQDLRNRLDRFAKDNVVDISTISTADASRWLDGLKVGPRTTKNFRTILYTLFQFAEAHGYVSKGMNPVAGVERTSGKHGGPIEIFTPLEMAALIKAASKELLPALCLGAFAGLRSAEIERLDWKNVDLAAGLIEVAAEKTKTRSRRLVPILPNLAAWLTPYCRRKGRVWNGNQLDLSEARAVVVKKSGVAWKNNGLRHSFISYRLAQIQNAAQVSLEAGNSPAMVFQNYRELVKPEAATAWFAIAPERPSNVLSIQAAKANS